MNLRLTCKCGNKLGFTSKHLGRVVGCPQCKRKIRAEIIDGKPKVVFVPDNQAPAPMQLKPIGAPTRPLAPSRKAPPSSKHRSRSSSSRKPSKQGAIRVNVSTCVAGAQGRSISETIYKDVFDHLTKNCKARTARINLRLDQFKVIGLFAIATLSVSGTVDGKQVRKVFKNTRKVHPTAGGGALLGLMAIFVSTIISALTPRDAPSKKLLQCVRECLADVRILLDKSTGQKKSLSAGAWNLFSWLRWLGTPLLFVGLIVFLLVTQQEPGRSDLPIFICISFFMAISFYLAFYLFPLVFMPAGFFRNDSRGRKALARTGFQSILGAKILAFLLGLFFLAILISFSLLLFNLVQENLGKP